MKGFGIDIKNNLLEPKHVDAMGQAVWLYMWLVDHMTSIDEEGVGKVLGGKPIKYDEIQKELGISQDTYTRWIEKLLAYPYIRTTRTPYGLVFYVLKAKKSFRKNAERYRKNANSFRNLAESNKDLTKDLTSDLTKKENKAAPAASISFNPDTFFFEKERGDDGFPMAFEEFVLLCRGSRHRSVRIIAEYAVEKKPSYATRGQWRQFGVRNMRAAKQLAPYTDRQLADARKKMDRDLSAKGGFINKWGLETLIKYLDNV